MIENLVPYLSNRPNWPLRPRTLPNRPSHLFTFFPCFWKCMRSMSRVKFWIYMQCLMHFQKQGKWNSCDVCVQLKVCGHWSRSRYIWFWHGMCWIGRTPLLCKLKQVDAYYILIPHTLPLIMTSCIYTMHGSEELKVSEMKNSIQQDCLQLCTSRVTAPQDYHKRLVLQVYLGSNTLEFSST